MTQDFGEVTLPPGATEGNLQERATAMASLIREKGMGLITGQFPASYYEGKRDEVRQITRINGFIMGDVQGFENSDLLLPASIPESLASEAGAIWVIERYRPPTKSFSRKEEVPGKRRLLGLGKAYRQVQELQSFGGKHGEDNWIQYTLSMPRDPVYDVNNRPGRVAFTFAVPPGLVGDIDKYTQEDAHFPDVLFQAINPRLVGPDTETHLRRLPANDLTILDRRENSEVVTREYPQTIPY